MKFCPFCGAALVGGAAPFCAECGKSLPAVKPAPPTKEPPARHRPGMGKHPPAPSGKHRSPEIRSPAKPAPKPSKSGTLRPASKKPVNKQSPTAHKPRPDPRDGDYDGYYNDVKPIDNGHTRDRMDPELVKRIVILSVGAFIIVILSVMLMYLL